MINNISWGSYIYALSFLLVVYYAVILHLYYRSDLLQLIRSKKLLRHSGQSAIEIGNKENIREDSNNVDSLTENTSRGRTSQVEQAAFDELSAYLDQAAKADIVKEELLFCLQQILRKYPMISSVTLQQLINNQITKHCKNKCSIHLNEDEVSGLWRG